LTDAFVEKIVAWAEWEEPIRGLALRGSRVEPGPAGRLSDYDSNVFVTDHESYSTDGWRMSSLADIRVHTEGSSIGIWA
jgi:hypothetical protein